MEKTIVATLQLKIERKIKMKKLVSVQEVEGEGLTALLGEKVLLMCANYFYTGKLVGVNADCVLLEEPSIVYLTGTWSDKTYADTQKLHAKQWYVATQMIESFGLSK